MAEDVASRRLRIHGRVQGVWFRGWMVDNAQRLGIAGWVRNRRDGSVEAVVRGPLTQVDELLRRCHIGPPAAEVHTVEVMEEAGLVEAGFRQLPSA